MQHYGQSAAVRAAIRQRYFAPRRATILRAPIEETTESPPAGLLDSDFGWNIRFADEPDGRSLYIVRDPTTDDVLKWGYADTLDDAWLDAIVDLKRPSGEQ